MVLSTHYHASQSTHPRIVPNSASNPTQIARTNHRSDLAPINTLQMSNKPTGTENKADCFLDLSHTMDSLNTTMISDSGISSPPLTPVSRARMVPMPTETDETFSLNNRRTIELLEFPFKNTDYTLDKRNLLGSGLWSDVYLAASALPKPSPSQPNFDVEMGEALTPPLTPVKRRNTASSIPLVSQAYAIKVPAMTSAKPVIASEARVLSYISSFPTYHNHIVPFFGLDTRNGALIMGAMANTLEKFITKDLNTLDDASRTACLAELFPQLALNLVCGLEWLDTHSVVHADVKPANILLAVNGTPVFADFSSSTITVSMDDTETKPAAPIGGGTWDFLCPSILTRDSTTSQYASPSTLTDVYSLAATLLFVIIGHSPFDSAGSNIFRRRDMIKQGTTLAFALGGDDGMVAEQRFKDLSAALRWDVSTWLQDGLRKVENRAAVKEWRESLETLVG